MPYAREDNFKLRLTNRQQLVMAVEKLMKRGVAEELIPVQLTRVFYVDLDELKIAMDVVKNKNAEKTQPGTEQVRTAA